MTATELIEELRKYVKEHGDREVLVFNGEDDIISLTHIELESEAFPEYIPEYLDYEAFVLIGLSTW